MSHVNVMKKQEGFGRSNLRSFVRGTWENHENPQDEICPGRDSNVVPVEYNSRPFPLDKSALLTNLFQNLECNKFLLSVVPTVVKRFKLREEFATVLTRSMHSTRCLGHYRTWRRELQINRCISKPQ
jgi:hypothetical protein